MLIKFIEHFTSTPACREHAFRLRVEKLDPLLSGMLHSPVVDFENKQLVIDLDGAPGYAASFLEEMFGGFVRDHGPGLELLIDLGIVSFISEEDPHLIDEIRDFVHQAEMRMV